MAMVSFETASGKKALINSSNICAVMEETKNGTICMIYMVDGEPWYVKDSIKEVENKIWKAEREEVVSQ